LVRRETDVVDAHVLELHEEIKALRQELRAMKGGDNG
jgi:voltage-gated sodium channel